MAKGVGFIDYLRADKNGAIRPRNKVVIQAPQGDIEYIVLCNHTLGNCDGGGPSIFSDRMLRSMFGFYEWYSKP